MKFFVSWNIVFEQTTWSDNSDQLRTNRLINTECEVAYRLACICKRTVGMIRASGSRGEIFSDVTQSNDFVYKALLVMKY